KTIVHPADESDYSLQADLAALAVLALLVITGLMVWKQWRASGGDLRAWLWRNEAQDWRTRLWPAALVITAGSLFMTTRLAMPLYRVVPGLPFLLFPFRWLLISSAGAALLTAAAVSLLARNSQPRPLKLVALVIITAFALTVSAL